MNIAHSSVNKANVAPPLVSIIIAVYNGANEILATINSARIQSHPNKEIIIIDGGSTDRTTEIIKSNLDGVSVFISEKDKGIADAWNKGLSLSSGRYITLLNCGDGWPPDYISTHVETMSGQEDVIQYGVTYMTSNGMIVARMDKPFDPSSLEDGFGFMHTSAMTSKTVYDKVGPFDITKRIAIDSDWMLRALHLGIDFKKAPVHNFMATGGISSRQWHKGQIEYMASLLAHGYLTHVPWQLRFRKWLQSHYLRLGLDKLRARGRMQTALCLIAALNLFNRCMPLHTPRNLALRLSGIRKARGAVIHQGVRLMARGRISVGEGTVINRGTLLDNRSQITIGKHVSVAHDCRIYTTGHNYQAPDFGVQTRSVYVDDYVVLFAGAVIMPGVHIGRGAVVLPFSVVTRNVDPLTVVGGIPATIKARRKSELQYRLDYNYWLAM